jgi:hypothetical protein
MARPEVYLWLCESFGGGKERWDLQVGRDCTVVRRSETTDE